MMIDSSENVVSEDSELCSSGFNTTGNKDWFVSGRVSEISNMKAGLVFGLADDRAELKQEGVMRKTPGKYFNLPLEDHSRTCRV